LFKECAAISYVSPPAEIEGSFMRSRFIASTLMRRAAWEKVGGFPDHLRSGEDLLFMTRVEEANFRIAFAPRAVVHWEVQPNIWRTLLRFTIYSRNNMRAGLWKQWQGPILSRYLVIALLALPVLVLGKTWLAVPLAVWLLLQLTRALVSIWRNRRVYPAGAIRNALRLLIIMPLIMVLDLGLVLGTLKWLLSDKLRVGAETVTVRHGT
jgi:cellulose synthase/poly-beta-1,6-N-acetylglucosamine synthase-like glycosyltransferase